MTQEFKPGDIVRLKGAVEEYPVSSVGVYEVALCHPSGIYFDVPIEIVELVRRPGPVVFECEWTSDDPRGPFYPVASGRGLPELKQFIGKKTKVTIEVIE